MVFCGKPSVACQPCRSKRRRCDLERPSCTQCLRAGIGCSGYRDASGLLFRDETAIVSNKAQRKVSRKSQRRQARVHLSSPSSLPEEQIVQLESLRILSPGLDTVATSYFLNLHVSDTAFSYLPQHLSRVTNDKTVMAAIIPTAMAAFAFNFRQPELLHQAHIHYSTALASTNNALSERCLVTLESTLLSVLLLSMFEALTFRGRKFPQAWSTHVNGLATILRLRGDGQFDDELGEMLFHHARNSILTSCYQQCMPVPKHLDFLQQRATSVLGNDHPGIRMGALLDGVATLKANMRGMLATNLVREALRLDRIAKEMMRDLEATCPYQVLPVEGCSDGVYNCRARIHHYPSQNAARQWNNARMLRIAFNEWIFCAFDSKLRGTIDNLPATDDPLYKIWDHLPTIAAVNFNETLEDILSSVPYSHDCLSKNPNASARFLVWPLASAAASELCPTPTKDFVINCLSAIGKQNRIEQADYAAKMLEEEVPIENWYVSVLPCP